MMADILWSPITRIIHWAIALPVLLNFFIDGGDSLHRIFGYFVAVFVLLRIIWGFISRDKANFKFFPLKPKEIKDYISILLSGGEKTYPGHNPLACVAYVLIWILVIALGITGFMMGLDAYWGEDWLEEIHESLSNGLAILVALHIIGLTIDSIRCKRKTWRGMITGKRE